MSYKCPVCGEQIKRDLTAYIDHTEKHIIDEIKGNHPDWVEKNGLCHKCLKYYRNQMKGEKDV